MHAGSARWLKRFGRTAPSRIQLFCLHHAGGAAALYRSWPRLLPDTVAPVAVQLPGRADRFGESAYERMEPLVGDLVEVLRPMLAQPFALYGTSMGARVAWALCHALRAQALSMPRILYVASNPAPRSGRGSWHPGKTDAQLVRFLHELGSTPSEAFEDPELLGLMLPTLRADLTLLDEYDARPAVRLDVPIRAFASPADTVSTVERMRGWRDETSAGFTLDLVSGGHLFDSVGVRQVIRTITEDLTG
ncbi:thioesterase domain-containing protein [Actinoplanes sp. NPDC026670]|jgi:medium-chain acyl-[acyl-carrier-protein] hydrolase|uniref:thioesterase II family protein n=1 Tax=Actinoplanes sp. NPDC026670 TaxID=3154700 RepID=UPI0034107479